MSDSTKDQRPSPPVTEQAADPAQQEIAFQERPRVMGAREIAAQLFSDYGMLVVLLLLVGFFSFATFEKRKPIGAEAAAVVAKKIAGEFGQGARALIVGRTSDQDQAFAAELDSQLKSKGIEVAGRIAGEPRDLRLALEQQARTGGPVAVIATTEHNARVVSNIISRIDGLAQAKIVIPDSYRWPTFLRSENLINVANQIVVIAIIAIGMTMVIITGGIDLSVGSLIALSAVATGMLIERMGGTNASVMAMTAASLAAIVICGLVGLLSGAMVSGFRMPPFIATLGVMLVASGLAYIISSGQSIYQIPDGFVWLGRGTAFFSIPNAVVLMIVLYAIAHVVMSRMTLGRYIYAVGGNEEAARLSGVNVRAVLLFVYTISGIMAGLGGVVLASQLKSGAPTYGGLYELYVIAAAVVGGTSLSGGQGKVIGTLIGALIIGVIQNGMNLTGVESYTQKVVLGLVILGAVLLDMLRKKK
jgi:ribose transport system permease protein